MNFIAVEFCNNGGCAYETAIRHQHHQLKELGEFLDE
jgi:hypothetical protein